MTAGSCARASGPADLAQRNVAREQEAVEKGPVQLSSRVAFAQDGARASVARAHGCADSSRPRGAMRGLMKAPRVHRGPRSNQVGRAREAHLIRAQTPALASSRRGGETLRRNQPASC